MTEKQVYEISMDIFNNSCAICGNPNVAMHHIRYGACGRHTYMGNIIPLCKKHHDLVHTNKKKYQPMLIQIIDEVINENNT